MQTKEGGKKVVEAGIWDHGSYEAYCEHMRTIGSRGGLAKSPNKGFGSMDPKKHLEASRKGGHNSKPYSRMNMKKQSLIRRLFNGR